MIIDYVPATNYFPINMNTFNWSQQTGITNTISGGNTLNMTDNNNNDIGYYYRNDIVGSNISALFIQFTIKVTTGILWAEISTGTATFVMGMGPTSLYYYPTGITNTATTTAQTLNNAFYVVKFTANDPGTGAITISVNGTQKYSLSPANGNMSSTNRVAFGKLTTGQKLTAAITDVQWEVYKSLNFTSGMY